MSSEIELKFRFPHDWDADTLFNHSFFKNYSFKNKRQINMESRYYDTALHTLSQEHASLRRRLENGVSVITLKSKGEKVGALTLRGEWEVHASSIEEGLPMLSELGAPQKILAAVKTSPLIVCAEFSFLRVTADIQISKTLTAAFCYDIGYLSRDGTQNTPLREVEFELISGSPQELTSFGQIFASHFGAEEETRSKLSRALDA